MPDKLMECAVKVAGFVKKSHFEAVIVCGGSAQLSRSLLVCGWLKHFRHKPMPKVFMLPDVVNRWLYKDIPTEGVNYLFLAERWVSQHLPELSQFKKRRICLVDDYAMTGFKCSELARAFKALGYERVSFAVFAATPRSRLMPRVFVAKKDNHIARQLCEMSSHIQGLPSYTDFLWPFQSSANQYRMCALIVLRALCLCNLQRLLLSR